MKVETEEHALYIRETRPVLMGDIGAGIRFTLEQRIFTKKRNDGNLPFPVKEIRCEEKVWGEIDVPESQVLIWLRDWIETGWKKKAGAKG